LAKSFSRGSGSGGACGAGHNHPFTIIGVTPPEFRGTFTFFAANFFLPIVNQDQVRGESSLNNRGSRGLIQFLAILERSCPGAGDCRSGPRGRRTRKSLSQGEYARGICAGAGRPPGNSGASGEGICFCVDNSGGADSAGGVRQPGSLFAARASDRSREVALRLALGSSRKRILRQLMTEALLISLAGGAAGLFGSVALLRRLDTWQPFSGVPIHVPVRPDANIYLVALLLALVSGFLFGIVPCANAQNQSI